jgi:hypothetical protein
VKSIRNIPALLLALRSPTLQGASFYHQETWKKRNTWCPTFYVELIVESCYCRFTFPDINEKFHTVALNRPPPCHPTSASFGMHGFRNVGFRHTN